MLRKSKQKSRIDVHLQLKGLKGWIDQDLFKFLNFLTFSSNKSYNQNCWWAIWFGHPWHMFLASLSTRSRIFSIWTHFIASSSHVLYPQNTWVQYSSLLFLYSNCDLFAKLDPSTSHPDTVWWGKETLDVFLFKFHQTGKIHKIYGTKNPSWIQLDLGYFAGIKYGYQLKIRR